MPWDDEQLDEQAGVADVAAEVVVDEMAAVAQQADGVGAHALDIRVLGHQHEDLQQGEGVRLKTLGWVTSM